jgi:hypothetical protein
MQEEEGIIIIISKDIRGYIIIIIIIMVGIVVMKNIAIIIAVWDYFKGKKEGFIKLVGSFIKKYYYYYYYLEAMKKKAKKLANFHFINYFFNSTTIPQIHQKLHFYTTEETIAIINKVSNFYQFLNF